MISKQYIKTLLDLQKEFSNKYYVNLHESFDPRIWLRSREVKLELIWPKDVMKEYEAFQRGECKSLDFAFLIFSNENKSDRLERIYFLTIKYSPYTSQHSSLIFYPTVYSHSCYFYEFQTVSLGKIYLTCKHVYAALREVDAIAKKLSLPIGQSYFYPRNPFLSERFEKIEKSKEKAEEKLKQTFKIIEEELLMSERKFLIDLNRRLKYLRKV
jgi:hypothetical protein